MLCLGLLVLPGGAAAPSRSVGCGGGSGCGGGGGAGGVSTNVDDNYFLQLAQGAESVSAGDSLAGRHTWGFNVDNSLASSLQGVAMEFDSDGSGNVYTDSKTFSFNYTFFPTDPNAFVSNHDCPTPTATQDVCPSPVPLPPDAGAITFFTGAGKPVTTTPGFDATRAVTPIANSTDSAVAVAVTLQDSRYGGGGASIRVTGQQDNADPKATPTVTAGGQPLPACPQAADTACAYASDFGAYQNGSATCEQVSLFVANAQVGTQYVFGWDENEGGGGCPTGEPGVGVLGFTGGTPPPTLQACDPGTDCSVTQSIADLGDVTLTVAAGQVTGIDVSTGPAIYSVNFPSEDAPAAPSGALSSDFGSSTTPTGTASATNDNTTASATGVGSLTVSQYGADPVSRPPFMASGNYFDVEVLSGSRFTTLTLKDCNLGGGNSLEWWNGTAWVGVVPDSPPGLTYDAGPPACLTGELSATSSPTLSQLGGTAFAVTNAPVLSLARSKLQLVATHVTVRLGCAHIACRGTATLRTVAKKTTKQTVLARARYAVAAGKKANVRLVLTPTGRKALARVTRSRAYTGELYVGVAHGSTLIETVRITR